MLLKLGWREIFGSCERNINGMGQGGGDGDGRRMCLEMEQTGLAGVDGEGKRNLGKLGFGMRV